MKSLKVVPVADGKFPSPPVGAVTFDREDFGAYMPRGFDPSRKAGQIVGIGMDAWPGRHLDRLPVRGGVLFTFRDAEGTILARLSGTAGAGWLSETKE